MTLKVTAVLNGQRVSISDFELEQLIAMVDDDNSGTLDLPELQHLLDHIDIPDSAVRFPVWLFDSVFL